MYSIKPVKQNTVVNRVREDTLIFKINRERRITTLQVTAEEVPLRTRLNVMPTEYRPKVPNY
jgi:hypothetical protein